MITLNEEKKLSFILAAVHFVHHRVAIYIRTRSRDGCIEHGREHY